MPYETVIYFCKLVSAQQYDWLNMNQVEELDNVKKL